MATGIARIGDAVTGICNGPGHPANRHFTGTWQVGSSTLTANGLGVVRANDTGLTDCGHHFKATGGSSVVTADGQPVHRLGDAVIVIEGGSGTTQGGSSTVLSN